MTKASDNEIRNVYLFLVNEDEANIDSKVASLPKGEIHKNASKIRVLKKMADQLDEKEFIRCYRTNEFPTVKLSQKEQELLKGGYVWLSPLINMLLDELFKSSEDRCSEANMYA